jgi:hypothetical protein
LAVALAAIGATQGHARGLPADCPRALGRTEASLEASLRRLSASKPSPARQCAAMRAHVAAMRAASAVFARCMTGHARGENMGQMAGSVADFEEIIAARCQR